MPRGVLMIYEELTLTEIKITKCSFNSVIAWDISFKKRNEGLTLQIHVFNAATR